MLPAINLYVEDHSETIDIRQATESDMDFVLELMDKALSPYYGGDHIAHAKRIFNTHMSGGKDQIGHFSFEQKMFVLTIDGKQEGLVHVVGKRQGNYKISPLIVSENSRGKNGLGSQLLSFAEDYAKKRNARQMYCTVAKQNNSALQFFVKKGYRVAGESDSHYKEGITEVMLYKPFFSSEFENQFDKQHISVHPFDRIHELQVRQLLLSTLPRDFNGIDQTWADALFDGYERRNSNDINLKYKLIFVAVDRSNTVLGVAGATPKKGEPIKLMPFIAANLQAFIALLDDIPYQLKPYGRKLYIHVNPTPQETIALQQRGWKLNAAMPMAYHDDRTTQQWSLDITGENFMRTMRVKQRYLDFIKKGQKTLEVRVAYDAIITIQPGERINIASSTENQIIRVQDVRRYTSFDEMLGKEQAEKIAPGLGKGDVLRLLKEIYPSNKERLGVVVLEIKTEK